MDLTTFFNRISQGRPWPHSRYSARSVPGRVDTKTPSERILNVNAALNSVVFAVLVAALTGKVLSVADFWSTRQEKQPSQGVVTGIWSV